MKQSGILFVAAMMFSGVDALAAETAAIRANTNIAAQDTDSFVLIVPVSLKNLVTSSQSGRGPFLVCDINNHADTVSAQKTVFIPLTNGNYTGDVRVVFPNRASLAGVTQYRCLLSISDTKGVNSVPTADSSVPAEARAMPGTALVTQVSGAIK